MIEATATAPRPRLLFVDDEQAVLDGITSVLRKEFDIVTATSGPDGLERLRADPTIVVVVSDMRMPRMNGASFLTRARTESPHSIRMLLTGQTDIEGAVSAINQGQIFRFLLKPCPRDELRAAVAMAVEHQRLQQVERELLEQTLRGSIKMLVDILALSSPAAFGRANRIKARVLELATAMEHTETWQLEIAALSSQLGYITMPRELCDKLEHNRPLTDEDRRVVARAPEAAATLLANIPRLEVVREIVAAHVRPPPRRVSVPATNPAAERARFIELGAHMLRFALDLDELETTSPALANDVIMARADSYDAEVVKAFVRMRETQLTQVGIKEIQLNALRVGMILADDVRMASDALLVTRGYEVTTSFIERVRNFPAGMVRTPLRVIDN